MPTIPKLVEIAWDKIRHPQFYAVLAIPLFHRFITQSRIDTWAIAMA